MALGVKSRKGKASVFRRFWSWLTRSESRDVRVHTPEPDAKVQNRQTEPMPAEPYPAGRIYKLLQERKTPIADTGELRVYAYCGVVFPKADIVYHYICPEEDIRVGERVLVPVYVHGEHKQAVGIVVSVGQYLSHCLPRPLGKTKHIIRKL